MKSIILKISFVLAIFCSSSVYALELVSFEGEKSSLEEQVANGKWSVVVFWSHSCGICRQETPALSEFHLKHSGVDAQVIGVSIDGQKKKGLAQQFMRETGMKFPSFIAELPVMAINFQQLTGSSFRGTPTFILYNPRGEIVGVQAGPVRIEALENFIAGNNS
ncbi:MAG: thiol-disulfide isomerase/thioredoxin [Oceanospirillaceae bacterium]|jgi:thiol-disulfide isomerase/thioredoxin